MKDLVLSHPRKGQRIICALNLNWQSAAEIAEKADNLSSVVGKYLCYLARCGFVDRKQVSPSKPNFYHFYLYRLKDGPETQILYQQVKQAANYNGGRLANGRN